MSQIYIHVVGSNLIDWMYAPDLDYRFHITRELQSMLHLQAENNSNGCHSVRFVQAISDWSHRDRE